MCGKGRGVRSRVSPCTFWVILSSCHAVGSRPAQRNYMAFVIKSGYPLVFAFIRPGLQPECEESTSL